MEYIWYRGGNKRWHEKLQLLLPSLIWQLLPWAPHQPSSVLRCQIAPDRDLTMNRTTRWREAENVYIRFLFLSSRMHHMGNVGQTHLPQIFFLFKWTKIVYVAKVEKHVILCAYYSWNMYLHSYLTPYEKMSIVQNHGCYWLYLVTSE